MTGPAASIIVPTRGGAARLPVLLGALARQDTRDFEVIVVVDGDVDGSADKARRWSAVLDVRPIVFAENRGRAAALNAGAEAARGNLLIRCDDDLEPASTFVSGHIARHIGGPCGVVGLTTNVLPNTPYALAYGRRADESSIAYALTLPGDRTWRLWSANVSVPRDAHFRVGGYDGRYRRYGWEDVDFGYRLRAAGYPIWVAPELMARHHGASTTTAVWALRALHSGAARETFLEIHGRDALPGADAGRGAWDRIVRAASTAASERTLRAYGGAVDAVARFMPRPVAEKLMALAVESAGLAGIRYPERAKATF
ncbi:glycosyltransferase [Sinomonas sp. ASV322]|uniref:glycosyltransferase family 2 protein n=1 Tax=Sinomonas sp. ASV322 TaxID=3041920 RepID=UPI0027DC49A1|nr:glycosyltransferase [Sinomonas sp. ASV322]MDQ4501909.1 glycosyltransferase [Sinomonas sp. ASV322]